MFTRIASSHPASYAPVAFRRHVVLAASLMALGPLRLGATIIQTNFSTGNGSAPGFAVSSSDLLQTSLSSVSNMTTPYGEGSTNVSVLYDGAFWPGYDHGTNDYMPQPGSITFNFDLTSHTNGYSLTTIRTYASWGDPGRDGQSYTVFYSTVSAPSTFVELTAISRFDADFEDDPATMVQLTDSTGTLATNVAALRFTFTAIENGGTGFSEFDVLGSASAIPEPSTYAALAGVVALGIATWRRQRGGRKG